ncbi:MAG TPA: HAD-IB family hydrolase [Steroidobacteraceae bacterium]|nr:HAD-IB family hydrolase [Steroidobacteraceae bacterium]
MTRLVVFDLDGTITRGDSLLPYVLGFLGRRPWELVRVLGAVPAFGRFLLGRADRGQLKSAFMRTTLGGRTRAELASWTEHFVARWLARRTYPGALRAIARHRDQGDQLVLLSASPDLYVSAIAARLGFSESISTGVRWEADRFDGRLTTPNRRGPEKTACVAALRQRFPAARTAAYANAHSDLDHLRAVDEPLLVNGSRRARRAAAELHIPLARWD